MYSRSFSSRGLKASAGYSVNPLFSARSDRSRPPRYLTTKLRLPGRDPPFLGPFLSFLAGETLLAVDDPDSYDTRSQRQGVGKGFSMKRRRRIPKVERPGGIALDVCITTDRELFSFPGGALHEGSDLSDIPQERGQRRILPGTLLAERPPPPASRSSPAAPGNEDTTRSSDDAAAYKALQVQVGAK